MVSALATRCGDDDPALAGKAAWVLDVAWPDHQPHTEVVDLVGTLETTMRSAGGITRPTGAIRWNRRA